VPRDTEKCEFLGVVVFGSVAFSVEIVIVWLTFENFSKAPKRFKLRIGAQVSGAAQQGPLVQ